MRGAPGTNLSEVDDANLVARAREGDPAAFAELVRRHEGRIFGLCLRMLRDGEEARETTQEVFVGAWRGMAAFRGDAAFSTWLYRIAVNLSLRRRRSAGRLRRALSRLAGLDRGGAAPLTAADAEIPSAPPAAVGPAPHSSARTPEEELENAERRRFIEQALDALSPELRAALLLRDRDGLSYEEVAQALRWRLGTVKSRLSRARGVMAEAIGRIAPDLVPRTRRR